MAKAGDVLKYRSAGPSVEEARKAMIEAGEAPKGELGQRTPFTPAAPGGAGGLPPTQTGGASTGAGDILEPEFREEPESRGEGGSKASAPASEKATLETQAKPASETEVPATVEPLAPEALAQPKAERIDTEHFTGEIRQEDGNWIGEIRYKSGAGTERFIAHTKNNLMLELLKGKGHATLRVKEAVRREKLGGPKLDQAYQLEALTTEEFEAMGEKAQDELLRRISREQAALFVNAHPEYHGTPQNAETFHKYLSEHKLPITLRNLEYAYEDLLDTGLLELKPAEVARASAFGAPVSVTMAGPSVAASDQEQSTAMAIGQATVLVPTPAAAGSTSAQPAVGREPAPQVIVRKRGASGLQPDQSSEPGEVETGSATGKPQEPSRAELLKLPPDELRRRAYAEREAHKGSWFRQ